MPLRHEGGSALDQGPRAVAGVVPVPPVPMAVLVVATIVSASSMKLRGIVKGVIMKICDVPKVTNFSVRQVEPQQASDVDDQVGEIHSTALHDARLV